MYEMVLTITSPRASACSRRKHFMSAPYSVTSFMCHRNVLYRAADIVRSNAAEAQTGLEQRWFTGLSGGEKKWNFSFKISVPDTEKDLSMSSLSFCAASEVIQCSYSQPLSWGPMVGPGGSGSVIVLEDVNKNPNPNPKIQSKLVYIKVKINDKKGKYITSWLHKCEHS